MLPCAPVLAAHFDFFIFFSLASVVVVVAAILFISLIYIIWIETKHARDLSQVSGAWILCAISRCMPLLERYSTWFHVLIALFCFSFRFFVSFLFPFCWRAFLLAFTRASIKRSKTAVKETRSFCRWREARRYTWIDQILPHHGHAAHTQPQPLFFARAEHKMSAALFIINYLMRDDVVFFPNKSFDVSKRSGCLMELRYANELARMCFHFFLSPKRKTIFGIGVCCCRFEYNCVCVRNEVDTEKCR